MQISHLLSVPHFKGSDTLSSSDVVVPHGCMARATSDNKFVAIFVPAPIKNASILVEIDMLGNPATSVLLKMPDLDITVV
jgi:hypothetical protein